MRRTPVLVALPAAALMTLGLAGCGLGDNAPHPGLAAEVDGARLTLPQLDTLVDAYCITSTADPQSQATSRAAAAQNFVSTWATDQAILQKAEHRHLTVPQSEQDLSQVPGWDTLSHDQQKAVQDYVDDRAAAEDVQHANPDLKVDVHEIHLLLNPMFGTSGELSVPVSSGAAIADPAKLTADQVAQLPESQLCGRRPAISAGS